MNQEQMNQLMQSTGLIGTMQSTGLIDTMQRTGLTGKK